MTTAVGQQYVTLGYYVGYYGACLVIVICKSW